MTGYALRNRLAVPAALAEWFLVALVLVLFRTACPVRTPR